MLGAALGDVTRSAALGRMTAAALLAIACQQGCAVLGDRPELHPDKWAPPRADREWIAPPATIRQFKVSDGGVDGEQHASARIEMGREYDLPPAYRYRAAKQS